MGEVGNLIPGLMYWQVGHLHKSKTGKSKKRIKYHREEIWRSLLPE